MSGETVIRAEGLERDYHVRRGMFSEGLVRAVAGVSFALETGRTLAVVGESGCGKSTLARLVTLIEPPTAGRLEIGGLDVSSAAAAELRALRKTVQIVFQDPYGSLNPRKRVGTILEEPVLINTDMDAAARRKAAMEMMERVGLRPEHYDRYPHMFSGGQRQRIAVARALMLNPKVVVLDEPVSALDVSIQAQVLNMLADLQRDFDLAYLFISHDLSVVRHIADDVLVMYLGRPVEQAPRDTLFAAPQHPYTRALLSATPVADPARRRDRIRLTGELPSPLDPPSGCAFHPLCPLANERCSAERPELKPVNGASVACHAVEEGRQDTGATGGAAVA